MPDTTKIIDTQTTQPVPEKTKREGYVIPFVKTEGIEPTGGNFALGDLLDDKDIQEGLNALSKRIDSNDVKITEINKKDAEQDTQINLKANKADSRLLNLRADNLSFSLDENRLPSPLNQSIKVHVDRNNIDGDVVITGKDVAPNTLDFEVKPEDMAKDGVKLKNIQTTNTDEWQSATSSIFLEYEKPLIADHLYYGRVIAKYEKIQAEDSTVLALYADGNTGIGGAVQSPEENKEYTLSFRYKGSSIKTNLVNVNKNNKVYARYGCLIDITELSARYPNLSDEELKTILDSSLPYISAQGEVELGNVIMLENSAQTSYSKTYNTGYAGGFVNAFTDLSVKNLQKNDKIYLVMTAKSSRTASEIKSVFIPSRPVQSAGQSSDLFDIVIGKRKTGVYKISEQNFKDSFGWFATTNPLQSDLTLSYLDGLCINLSSSLLDLWLSLNGYTTDEQKAEWCNEHIPPFEGTYSLWVGAIKDEHTVTATCGEYSSSLTFKTVLGKDSVATQPYVDNALRDKADVITNTFRGATPFVRTDTDEEPLLGMTIYGKTEQFSTEGKNLFDIDAYPSAVEKQEDGSYKANPDSGLTVMSLTTGASWTLSYEAKADTNFNYRIEVTLADGTVQHNYADASNGTWKKFIHTYSQPARSMRVTYATGAFGFLRNIQVENGSSATSYEPYTGGKPSPSPDYPQDIKTAGASGSIVTRVQGKNLLDIQSWFKLGANKDYYQLDGDKLSIISEDLSAIDRRLISVIPNKEYTLSIENICSIRIFNSNVSYIAGGNVKSVTFTTPKDGLIALKFDASSYPFKIGYLQLELSDHATSYEPYKPVQIATATTPNGMNGMNGVYDERDYATGKDIKRYKTFVLNGSEDWTHHTPYKRFALDTGIKAYSNYSEMGNFSKSDYFGYKASVWFDRATDEGFCVDEKSIFIRFKEGSEINSLETFKQFLTQNPVTLTFAVASPVITDIPQEEMAQFSSLKTYNPNTTISNDDGTEVYIKYRAETSRIVEQMAREIARQEIAPINNILNGFMGKADLNDETSSYTVLPNGVLMQWGRIPFNNVTTGEKTIMFKRSFKNDKLSLNAVSAGVLGAVTIKNWAKDKIELMISKQAHIFWFAVGQDSEV